LALERYRANLSQAGALPEQGSLAMPLRRLFQTQLRRAGVEKRYIDMLMGRVVEPSKFMDVSDEMAFAVRALVRLPLPSFYRRDADLGQDA
jgi:hypothetical protein